MCCSRKASRLAWFSFFSKQSRVFWLFKSSNDWSVGAKRVSWGQLARSCFAVLEISSSVVMIVRS